MRHNTQPGEIPGAGAPNSTNDAEGDARDISFSLIQKHRHSLIGHKPWLLSIRYGDEEGQNTVHNRGGTVAMPLVFSHTGGKKAQLGS